MMYIRKTLAWVLFLCVACSLVGCATDTPNGENSTVATTVTTSVQSASDTFTTGGDTVTTLPSESGNATTSITESGHNGVTDPTETDPTSAGQSVSVGNDTTATVPSITQTPISGNTNVTTVTAPTTAQSGNTVLTYEAYMAMSAEQQQAYFESFADVQSFFAWYNAAKAEYEKENSSIEIGGNGNIDIGDIIGGRG